MFLRLPSTTDKNAIRINEHGQVVVMNRISAFQKIGIFSLFVLNEIMSGVESWRLSHDPPPSQIHRWSSSLTTSRKENLRNAYDAIKQIVWRPYAWGLYPLDRVYGPGSVLTLRGGTLVARIPIRLDECDMRWKGSDSATTEQLFHWTHDGSITVPLPYTSTRTYLGQIHLRSSNGILDSWIGQASQLESSIRSKGHVKDDELSLINTSFILGVEPGMYDPFRLCDTFMAEDHHTLSLSIRAPSVEHQTNEVSRPVFTWYDGDLEISSGEAEDIFGVKLIIDRLWQRQLMPKMLLTTML
ncbi:hypothetical protein F5146DRAFT_1029808 [Armillaria mellea]|nr:hypothetical protein F5146DRAFT_1029808 [Armillaria mellea]